MERANIVTRPIFYLPIFRDAPEEVFYPYFFRGRSTAGRRRVCAGPGRRGPEIVVPVDVGELAFGVEDGAYDAGGRHLHLRLIARCPGFDGNGEAQVSSVRECDGQLGRHDDAAEVRHT